MIFPLFKSIEEDNGIRGDTTLERPAASVMQLELIGIVGSEFMGTGIAAVSAEIWHRVAIKDVSQEKLSVSLRAIWKSPDRRSRPLAVGVLLLPNH